MYSGNLNQILIAFKLNAIYHTHLSVMVDVSNEQIERFHQDIKITLLSQRFVFEGKTEPFLLENASNLTHEFLYDNLKKKI